VSAPARTVAFAASPEALDLDAGWPLLRAAVAAAGLTPSVAVWGDPAVDWSAYRLVVLIYTWGYVTRRDRFLAWAAAAARATALVNPEPVVRWNSDKAYLAELDDAGIATVPTLAVDSCCDADLDEARRRFGTEWLVIKPPVSASATGTHRIGPNDDLPTDSRGKATIIQPLIEEIARTGEFSLMLFDGEFSHAIVKRPKPGDFRVQPHLGGVSLPCTPPAGTIELAKQALAAAPARATYARVDIIPDDEGTLRIMELELIEPALYLDLAPDGGRGFVNAILRAARTATAESLK
jgi:glutathione synthase/RimK-type ligase-like ATP-grasp enzyme